MSNNVEPYSPIQLTVGLILALNVFIVGGVWIGLLADESAAEVPAGCIAESGC